MPERRIEWDGALALGLSPSRPSGFILGTEPAFAFRRRYDGLLVVLLAGDVVNALPGVHADVAFDIAARAGDKRLHVVQGKTIGAEAKTGRANEQGPSNRGPKR